MEKTLTLHDLQHYFQEINQIEVEMAARQMLHGPGKMTLQNLLRYSQALNILKTRTAGTICRLSN